jgi:hypothetical protein
VRSARVAGWFWSAFAFAVGVQVVRSALGADRDATGWAIWRVFVATVLVTLAGLWLALRFAEDRRAAGGTGRLVAPWVRPAAAAGAVVCVAAVLQALLP